MADNRQNPQQQKKPEPPAKQVGTPIVPGQPVVPADVPEPPPELADMSHIERQVAAAGFEPLYRNAHHEMVWQDPNGEGAKRVDPKGVALRLPEKNSDTGEREKVVYQSLAPAASWKLTTSQALRTIKLRQGDGGTPLMRLETLGKKFDALCELYEQTVASLEPLLRRPVPEKRENLAKEVGDLKTAVAQTLHLARQRWDAIHPKAEPQQLTELRKGEPAA